LIASTLAGLGVPRDEAKRACWLVDSRGLVVTGRSDLAEHKRAYAHEAPGAPDLLSAIRTLEPTALIGVSGQASTFTREILQTMARLNPRPIVFALSNPTANSECTASEAYAHTEGRALFASGSPFPAVEWSGRTLVPGQANNAYVFPGVALGVIASRASRVTDDMFAAAARTLASLVTEEALTSGVLFPPLSSIRDVSMSIAVAVARVAFASGLATVATPHDLEGFVRAQVFEPVYPSYV
jgi:malate dehydrogenase (oxaloacetate-decarboxylating)(NADP+)